MTLEEVLSDPRMVRYLRSISSDDLRQEARIAIWKALPKSAGSNPVSYLMTAAKWRVSNVASGSKLQTGQEPFRGRPRAEIPVEVDPEHPSWGSVDPETMDYSDQAVVREAVNTLPDVYKDRVFRRFWLDEAVHLTGKWWCGDRGVRNRLLEELEWLRHSSAHNQQGGR